METDYQFSKEAKSSSGGGRVLNDAEVEFLLGDPGPESAEGLPAHRHIPADQEVTMRGDLDKINLADIFQTLAMSKMEGFLRVSNPVEHREVYFKDGHVRCLSPTRSETLRIGQRLIRAGYLSAEQLRSALLLQKKARKPLGVILAENDYVSQGQIEEIILNQVQEDLFNLFTWGQGHFEFYKGTVTDEVTLDRLGSCPQFEVNGVLLEVARRSDEWSQILAALTSLDEIFEIIVDHRPDDLSEDHNTLLDAVDGRRNVRDLADMAVLGLFEAASKVRELYAREIVDRVPIETVLGVAREQLADGDVKRATMTIHALLDREDAHSADTMIEVAETLSACGEHRTAGELLVEVGRVTHHRDEALQIARRALEFSKRSIPVLQFLLELLQADPRRDERELASLTYDLADCLDDEERYEEALEELDRIAQMDGQTGRVVPKRARVLAKLGRGEEAVTALLAYAEQLKSAKRRERLIQVYEQILKIDYTRKDVARALKALHASKLAKRGKLAAIAFTILAACGAAYWVHQQSLLSEQFDLIEAQIDARLAENDVPGALAILQQARVKYESAPRIESWYDRIDAVKAQRHRRLQAKLAEEREILTNDAAAAIREGRLTDTLDIYDELARTGLSDASVTQIAQRHLLHIQDQLNKMSAKREPLVPEGPSILQTHDQHAQILRELDANFPLKDMELVEGMFAAKEDKRLESYFRRDEFAKFVATLNRAKALFDNARIVKEQYRNVLSQTQIHIALHPIFNAAREAKERYDFETALRLYKTLRDRHPGQGQLKQTFRDEVQTLSRIVRFLGLIEKATAAGDFVTAQQHLRTLEDQFPDIPFKRLVYLPVRVVTTPPGAIVFVDGEAVGKSPFTAKYKPAETTKIRVELEGFHAEGLSIRGDNTREVRSLMARKSTWQHSTRAPIDRAPVADRHGRIFLSDRSGTITALEVDGTTLWTFDTQDLNGLLSRGAVLGDQHIVYGSIDGTLRCLDRSNGDVVWTYEPAPSEAAPVCTESVVVIASEDRLVGLKPADGTARYTFRLPGEVRGDLIPWRKTVIAVTIDGTAVSIETRGGKERWRTQVGTGCASTPTLTKNHLVVAADDTLTVLDVRDGKIVWQVTAFGSLTLPPAVVGERVFVAEDRTLYAFDLASGRELGTRVNDDTFTSISAGQASLYAGDSAGVVKIFDPATLEVGYLLRGVGASTAPVVELPDGSLLAPFEDRSLRAYAPR